jgi:uncharacterized protein
MDQRAIIIFQKNAIPGKVKTRIAEELGDQAALEIYMKLVDHTHQVCQEVDAQKFVFFSDFIPEDLSGFNPHDQLIVQSGNDLGWRMANAFKVVFSKGFKKILIVGTDCLELKANLLEEAFELLKTNQVVIGPARDGGYYLLGLQQLVLELFQDIEWSSEKVFWQTMKKLDDLSLSYDLLRVLSDVDRLADWQKFNKKQNYE